MPVFLVESHVMPHQVDCRTHSDCVTAPRRQRMSDGSCARAASCKPTFGERMPPALTLSASSCRQSGEAGRWELGAAFRAETIGGGEPKSGPTFLRMKKSSSAQAVPPDDVSIDFSNTSI